MKLMLIFHHKDWFSKRFFKDSDGCFWETETLRNDFEIDKMFSSHLESEELYPSICQELQGDCIIINSDDFNQKIYQAKMWGIKKL